MNKYQLIIFGLIMFAAGGLTCSIANASAPTGVEYSYKMCASSGSCVVIFEWVPIENPDMVCMATGGYEHIECIPRATASQKRRAEQVY